MRGFFRKLLKRTLGYLAKLSIARYGTEVILVVGWTGSSIVREMIYHLLKDHFNVRRSVSSIWRDLSVPLNILGYEDKKRNVFEWFALVLKSFRNILIKRKYPHKIVINLDTFYEDTAKYWAEYIIPDIVVVLRERPESRLIDALLKQTGGEKILFVHDPKLFKGFKNKNVREFIYSQGRGDLIYKKNRGKLEVHHKDEKVSINIPERFKFIYEYIPPSLSCGILQGIKLKNLTKDLSYFEFHPEQVRRALLHLKKFLSQDEE